MFRRFGSESSCVAARNALAGIAVLAAALASAAGRASAQSDWDKVVAEAKKEGKVVIYNGTNFKIVRQLGDQFQKEYGIAVEVLDGRASEIRERIRTEQAAGRAIGDLIYSGATSIALQTAEGAFKPHGPLPLAGKTSRSRSPTTARSCRRAPATSRCSSTPTSSRRTSRAGRTSRTPSGPARS